MSIENLKAKIDRFKTADVDREVLKLAQMASDICFVWQLIERIEELERKVNFLEYKYFEYGLKLEEARPVLKRCKNFIKRFDCGLSNQLNKKLELLTEIDEVLNEK